MGPPRIVFPPSFQFAGHTSPGSSFVRTAPCQHKLLKKCPIDITHRELERLDGTQRLVGRATDRQIVHRNLPQHILRIDQIARTERDPLLVLDRTPVLLRHAHVTIGQRRDMHIGPEATRGVGLLRAGLVRALRVGLRAP